MATELKQTITSPGYYYYRYYTASPTSPVISISFYDQHIKCTWKIQVGLPP